MQAVGPTQLIVLLVAVAVIAAACGFLGSALVRRRKRRARGVFVLGFLCGVTASTLVRTRRRVRHALRIETRSDAYRLAARVLALTAGRSRS